MAAVAKESLPKFVVNVGDNFYPGGISSPGTCNAETHATDAVARLRGLDGQVKRQTENRRGPPKKYPFYRFFFGGEGSPTKIDNRKKVGTLILSSPLEGLATKLHTLQSKGKAT